MDGNDTAKKVALCSALFAGFAYFSLSLLREAFTGRKSKSGKKSKGKKEKTSISSQTELTFPIGVREKTSAWHNIPPELWTPWAKSIHERIRELNLSSIINSNGSWTQRRSLSSAYSLQNSPRHTPRATSPDLYSLSRSEEHLNELHVSRTKQLDKSSSSSRSNIGLNRVLKYPTEAELKMYEKILNKLHGKSNVNLSQQEASVLTLLLLAKDVDLLTRTLSVISNCSAFSVNIDPICDSGCILMLHDLLTHHSEVVLVAATQAVANLAMSERVQELAKPMIPLLTENLKNAKNDLQLMWTVFALANLAMKDCNHIHMVECLHSVSGLISTGSPSVRLQSLKLLVNLSCNSEMIPYILASKCPPNLYALLDSKTDGEVLLRLCTLLANVIQAAHLKDIKPEQLPSSHKAASPETIYSALFGQEVRDLLLKRVKNLEQSPHEDIRYHTNRILKYMS